MSRRAALGMALQQPYNTQDTVCNFGTVQDSQRGRMMADYQVTR